MVLEGVERDGLDIDGLVDDIQGRLEDSVCMLRMTMN